MTLDLPELYRHDRFLARRSSGLFGIGFRLRSPDGSTLAASYQGSFGPRRAIRLREGRGEGRELLSIRAGAIIDPSATHEIRDPSDGAVIGSIRRQGGVLPGRPSWAIRDPSGALRGRVDEVLADRGAEGGAPAIARPSSPTGFRIVAGDREVGRFALVPRRVGLEFEVDLGPEADEGLPRRLALAAVIFVLAIEGRQD